MVGKQDNGEKMLAMFKKYDANGDGQLSRKELSTILKALDKNIKDAELEIAFKKADKNSDGMVDVPEFLAWIQGGGKGAQAIQKEAGQQNKELHGPERFFYDTSTYTGAKADHVDDRSKRLSAAGKIEAGADERDWRHVELQFQAFCGKDKTINNAEFAKVCRDCNLFAKGFKKEDVDSVFMKVVEKGKRSIDFEQLKDAIRLIAAKRGCSVSEVQNLISESSGPLMQATQADYVKFHDDKSTYTGVYAKGGPDCSEKGDFYEGMRK
eukprot:gnl/TRDRNA2_/TRDRNA2_174853_c1_seq1.p1 gnl/TRDRNA2_/TRDRNA2_174853_c1~~gnl/TRDRNA2_/TRDRNA2_174853_c1_seq1.p1  ORF type:complete len:291 (-),score=78.48 gnl/TRDRNA2_/TRDRNA2_174853_c1_seq1:390-1190(-)